MEEERERILSQCWNQAIYSFGTGWIFEQRAKELRIKQRLLSFFGLLMPVFIGGIVLSFGKNFEYLDKVIYIAGIVAIVQFIVSLWSLISNWGDSLGYSLESKSSNYRISREYEKMAMNPPNDISILEKEFNLLELRNNQRVDQDVKIDISEMEKRKGMRAALRQFGRECAHCNEVPSSMNSSICPVCGNF